MKTVKRISKFVSLSVLVFVLFGGAGCSNQWRDADAEISASDMLQMLNEAKTSASSSTSLSQALSLAQDPNAAIYFADAPSPLGTVASIASLVDWSFIGSDGANLWYGAIESVRIFFIDAPTSTQRKTGLVIGIKKKGSQNYSYYGFVGTASMFEEEYETVLSLNGQPKLVLYSTDVGEGDLNPTIQLKAWKILPNGAEDYIGKFSTLVGFGP